MITIHEVEQGSPEWRVLREGLYTGSNAHKLLKYGAIDYSLTASGNFAGNFWTKRGHILEEEAVGLYEAITKTKVDRPGFVTNSKYPMCGYSPDGLPPVALLEVKCFGEKEHMKLINGTIKLEVLAQIHFGLLITGRIIAHLVAYNPEIEDPLLAFKIIVIRANRAIQNNFKRILAKGTVNALPTPIQT